MFLSSTLLGGHNGGELHILHCGIAGDWQWDTARNPGDSSAFQRHDGRRISSLLGRGNNDTERFLGDPLTMNVPVTMLPVVLDVLRHEGPLQVDFNTALGKALLYTATTEPVGEDET